MHTVRTVNILLWKWTVFLKFICIAKVELQNLGTPHDHTPGSVCPSLIKMMHHRFYIYIYICICTLVYDYQTGVSSSVFMLWGFTLPQVVVSCRWHDTDFWDSALHIHLEPIFVIKWFQKLPVPHSPAKSPTAQAALPTLMYHLFSVSIPPSEQPPLAVGSRDLLSLLPFSSLLQVQNASAASRDDH